MLSQIFLWSLAGFGATMCLPLPSRRAAVLRFASILCRAAAVVGVAGLAGYAVLGQFVNVQDVPMPAAWTEAVADRNAILAEPASLAAVLVLTLFPLALGLDFVRALLAQTTDMRGLSLLLR